MRKNVKEALAFLIIFFPIIYGSLFRPGVPAAIVVGVSCVCAILALKLVPYKRCKCETDKCCKDE